MRIRTIKPEFWRSDDIDALCIEDRLLFIGLWSYVDDSGVGVDKESSIAADLFAGDLAKDFSETSLRIHEGLKRLEHVGLIHRYSSGGRRYLHVTTFDSHQKINRPTPSRLPPPTSADEPTPPPHGGLSEGSLRARKEQGNRGTGEQEQGNPPDADASDPPTGGSRRTRGTRIDPDFAKNELTLELRQWVRDECPLVTDPKRATDEFVDYWIAIPGQRGTKLDWQRTWKNRMRELNDRAAERQARRPSRTAAGGSPEEGFWEQ